MRTKKTDRCDCTVIHGDTVETVRREMLSDDGIHALSNLYKMLGDASRIKILWALSVAEMCVCDLAVLTDMTKSAVSHALARLKKSKLVKCDKRGKSVFYSLADNHVRDIVTRATEHVFHC